MDDRQRSGYELCLRQGKRYQQTGNIRSLKPAFGDYDFMQKHGLLPDVTKTREAKGRLLQTGKARHNAR
jgi:hypothetical protein